ncbi:MAG: inositol monophosphatase family protein [Planctomycetota bacterium]
MSEFTMDDGTAARLATDLEEIARAAGAVLMTHLGRLGRDDVDFKGRRDLLTIADRESEALIVAEIARRHPDHAILAEEASAGGALRRPDAEWTWIVDPLDGTTNFVHQVPMFAVSIGVVRAGVPVAGCIFAPRLDELFLGVAGRGAFLNGVPIRCGGGSTLEDDLLATGFAYRMDAATDDNLAHFCRLVKKARAVRRCGSAALDLAYVAAGRFGGFWEFDLSPWDVAAGAALVRAAGGLVTDVAGGDDWLFGRSIAAAHSGLHPRLLDELAAGRG